MKVLRFFLFFFMFMTCLLCYSVESVREKTQLKNGLVSLIIPNQWQSTKDLFGVPLTLLGPETDGARPVVLFTPTGIYNLKFDQGQLKKNQEEFKTGREAWLQAKKGKSLQYFPYQMLHLKSGTDIHQIGYSYELNDLIFLEYSYFILCENQLIHATALVRKSQETKYNDSINKIIESFECK